MQRSTSEQRSAMLTPALSVPVDVFNWDPRGVPEPGTGLCLVRPDRAQAAGRVRHGPVLAGRSADAGAGRTHERVEPAGARRRQPHRSRVHALWRPDPGPGPAMVALCQLRAGVPAAERAHARRQVARSCHGHQLRSRRQGELADGALNVSLAVFQIQQKDRAQQDPDWPCVGNNCYYIAGGEVRPRRRGRGLGPHHAGLDPVRRLHLQHQQIPEGRDGRRSAYASFTPRHIFRLWTRYALPSWTGA